MNASDLTIQNKVISFYSELQEKYKSLFFNIEFNTQIIESISNLGSMTLKNKSNQSVVIHNPRFMIELSYRFQDTKYKSGDNEELNPNGLVGMDSDIFSGGSLVIEANQEIKINFGVNFQGKIKNIEFLDRINFSIYAGSYAVLNTSTKLLEKSLVLNESEKALLKELKIKEIPFFVYPEYKPSNVEILEIDALIKKSKDTRLWPQMIALRALLPNLSVEDRLEYAIGAIEELSDFPAYQNLLAQHIIKILASQNKIEESKKYLKYLQPIK